MIIGEISKEQLNRKLEKKILIRSKETDKIIDVLQKHGMGNNLIVSGDTITLSGNDVNEEQVGSWLHESGAVLLEFTQTRETLESYFIGLIGGNSHA